jgi:MICOS complex subunit MIC19
MSRLRQEEQDVQQQIEFALERENLDRERHMIGGAAALASQDTSTSAGDVKTGAILLGDLEEIQRKVDRFQSRHCLEDLPELKAKGDAVVSCYKSVFHFVLPPVISSFSYLELTPPPFWSAGMRSPSSAMPFVK